MKQSLIFQQLQEDKKDKLNTGLVKQTWIWFASFFCCCCCILWLCCPTVVVWKKLQGSCCPACGQSEASSLQNVPFLVLYPWSLPPTLIFASPFPVPWVLWLAPSYSNAVYPVQSPNRTHNCGTNTASFSSLSINLCLCLAQLLILAWFVGNFFPWDQTNTFLDLVKVGWNWTEFKTEKGVWVAQLYGDLLFPY